MSMIQDTRLARLQGRIGQRLQLGLSGPWFQRSSVLIALLGGFLIGSTYSEHLNNQLPHRTFSALFCLIAVELLIRLRDRVDQTPLPMQWQIVDNVRVGFIYAIVLEAFKVGS